MQFQVLSPDWIRNRELARVHKETRDGPTKVRLPQGFRGTCVCWDGGERLNGMLPIFVNTSEAAE